VTAKRSRRSRPPQRARAPVQRRSAVPLFAAAIAIVGIWAYATSFTGVFVLDDVRAIVRNETIRTLWPPTGPLAPPTGSTVAGRPVANLSFAINYALAPAQARDAFTPGRPDDGPSRGAFLQNVWGYHLGNLLVHLAAALTLFGVVRRTLMIPRLAERFGGIAAHVACTVALVWVVHPLTTESVTYLVQRVESLMGLFYLLTVYCAIRAEDDASRRVKWMAASIASCALGMSTKETMVSAPLAVAVWHYVFTDGLRTRWRRVAALAATWLVLAVLVAGEGRGPSVDVAGGTMWRYLLTQAAVIVHYLRLSVVPFPLVFLYTWPLTMTIGSVAPQFAVVTALVAATVVALVRRHPLAFPAASFFLILAPTSSVLPIVTEVAAEHRMYLPLASVISVIVIAAYALGLRLMRRGPLTSRRVAMTGIVLVAAATAVYAELTRVRNRDYASELTLWADTVSKQPDNVRARVAYGTALAAARELSAAKVQFRAAVGLNDADPIAHARLGSVLAAEGEMDAAILHLQRALALNPDDPDAHRALGRAYAARRQDAEAAAHLGRAAAAHPDDVPLLAELAGILADSRDAAVRDPARAAVLAEGAARLTARRDPAILEVLSVAYAAAGRFRDAAATASEALPLARAGGDRQLTSRLEYRAAAYAANAR
jgi:Flp pilus assembly protein TadD